MFSFKDNTLKIRKVDIPSLDINIMDDLQQSYRKFLEKTIFEDMEYLRDKLRELVGMQNIDLKVRVGDRRDYTYKRTQVREGNHFYPVYITFLMNGNPVSSEWEVLRIPYMDDYGKINIDGASKVVLSILRAAEDISYSMKSNMFNIAMPYANVRIYGTNKHIKMSYGKNRYHMHSILRAMLWEAGDNSQLSDIFTNTFLINAMKLDNMILNQYVYNELKGSTDLLTKFKSVQYKLGKTRNALNENLNLRRAIGQYLSRDVLTYRAGTKVTEAMVKDFTRNRINIIHVQNNLLPTGYHLASSIPLIFTSIPAGMRNCDLLKEKIPEFANETEIPRDYVLSQDDAIIITDKDILTIKEIQFLINGGYTCLDVCAGNSTKVIKFSFEREIVGNYTARLGELTNDIPDNRSADEWVYYYNNPTLEACNPEYLTCHDLIAVVSTMGEILLTGKTTLLDLDNAFLKKILMVNEVFSENLRRAIDAFVHQYQSSIAKAVRDGDSTNPFWSLTAKWISTMNEERVLAPADTINLSAEISQVNHVVTLVPNASEVKDEQRHLAMPFYGRICPYETPAGKKLGIVNTKAVGARIKDGLALTPYYKVIRTATGIRISDKITWMSVKDELGHKFGDILQLQQDANGNYINNQVLARIPNPEQDAEPFIFKNINAFDLADGYVPAVPEQFLSPTACLIPFACSDDPVRISYGLSQIRQTVYEVNSQIPRVTTSMYHEMFNYSGTEKYHMPCDGTITFIDNMRAEIKGVDGSTHTVLMQGSSHLGCMNATMELNAKVGDYLSEGEVIGSAHKYPQPFVVRAPYDGTILDITDTEIVIYKGDYNGGFVNLDNTDYVSIVNGRISGQSAVFLNFKVSVGDYVHKGDILADTCASRGGVYSPSRNPLTAYDCYGYNHEDGIVATENASVEYTSIITHHIDEMLSKRHYKYHNAYGIGGFKYCAPGDKIGYVKSKSNPTDKDGHNRDVRATGKAHGIPFEYGVHDSDANSTIYRYHLLGFNKLQSGDKMSGRHGNKGVVSKVLNDSMAPQLMNGMTVRFILNPCGVPSRMNLGQIWEAHASLCAEVLNIIVESDAFNGASVEDINTLMLYTHRLANTPSIGEPRSGNYNRAAFDAVCSAFPQLPKALHEHAWSQLDRITDWRGVFDEDGSAVLYDPETDTFFDGKMVIGFPQLNKLMQEADEKINSRAGVLEEQYALTTSQPQKGYRSAKGQRMAEMELMALAALGTAGFIDEIVNEKSDNSGRRANLHLQQLGFENRVDEHSCYSRSVENLLYLLEGCGVYTELPEDVCRYDHRTSMRKYDFDVPLFVSSNLNFNQKSGIESNEIVDDFNFED